MSPSFVHLHLHSEFSLRDSTIRIKGLIQRCVELGQPAVALTDDSNLFALVKFYRAAMAAGIKPIAGADVWVAEPGQAPGRFTLLCQDHAGYLNLARLVSRAYREGHQGERVVVEAAWLDAMNEGLIALAGRDSEIGMALREGRDAVASQALQHWHHVFGDRLCL
ncbi:MAG: PHP domain-containing protein, partial [Xanthomonadales bacterium]|nr:PHP domain-containing protein [Xanthomonadales bacterium]